MLFVCIKYSLYSSAFRKNAKSYLRYSVVPKLIHDHGLQNQILPAHFRGLQQLTYYSTFSNQYKTRR